MCDMSHIYIYREREREREGELMIFMMIALNIPIQPQLLRALLPIEVYLKVVSASIVGTSGHRPSGY